MQSREEVGKTPSVSWEGHYKLLQERDALLTQKRALKEILYETMCELKRTEGGELWLLGHIVDRQPAPASFCRDCANASETECRCPNFRRRAGEA